MDIMHQPACLVALRRLCSIKKTLGVFGLILGGPNVFCMKKILHETETCILLDVSLTVKAAPHECVIRTGQPWT